jgi:hypothetical protein
MKIDRSAMMIQQPAFRIDEILVDPTYTEERREAILTVLRQASEECKLISRACTVATNHNLLLPQSPEALMSFMLYETQVHESLARSFHETMTKDEKTLDLQATTGLAKIWEYIALLRKFANLLYALRVEPEQITWERIIAEPQEDVKKHTHSFGFVLKGSIGMTHEHYAEAYAHAVEAMELLIQQLEREAGAIEGVAHALVIDSNITFE